MEGSSIESLSFDLFRDDSANEFILPTSSSLEDETKYRFDNIDLDLDIQLHHSSWKSIEKTNKFLLIIRKALL